MFSLQLLYLKSATYKLYSPWMERQGNYLAVLLSMDQFSGTPRLGLDVFHKDRNEAGDGASVGGTPITITASVIPGNTVVSGLKELVRYEFTIYGSSVSGTTGDWFLFRVLDPVWWEAAS
ncbi:MAG: hypothetical protein R3C29_17910 [Dehalococcoidia bacterium]